jgi:hypothetical protein
VAATLMINSNRLKEGLLTTCGQPLGGFGVPPSGGPGITGNKKRTTDLGCPLEAAGLVVLPSVCELQLND